MDDDIQLPPLPRAFDPMHTGASMQAYARAAVLADRERRAKVAAKPVVYSRTLHLTDGGHVFRAYENTSGHVVAIIRLRWTSDGKAWIDSEKNRELARRLRLYLSGNYDGAVVRESADALDGGER